MKYDDSRWGRWLLLTALISLLIFSALSVYHRHTGGQQADTPANDSQLDKRWYLHDPEEHGIGLSAAKSRGLTGKGVTVAIIDTGLQFNHPDAPAYTVQGRNYYFRPDANGKYTFEALGSKNTYGYYSNDDVSDENGHGTYLAGIIAAPQNNKGEIEGIAPNSTVYICKAFDTSKNHVAGNAITVASCIRDAVGYGVDIINLSLSVETPYNELRETIMEARAAGCIVIASSGDDADTALKYPASWPEVISVAGTDKSGQPYADGTFNQAVDLCAPGEDIYSLWKDSNYATGHGTSPSASIVAAVAALCKEAYPHMTQEDFLALLDEGCDPILDGSGKSVPGTGRGILNLEKLLSAANRKWGDVA